MRYKLFIRESNIKPHLDIENDIQALQNGNFNFVIRFNGGNITSYIIYENIDAQQYVLGKVIIQESVIAYTNRERNTASAIWPVVNQYAGG